MKFGTYLIENGKGLSIIIVMLLLSIIYQVIDGEITYSINIGLVGILTLYYFLSLRNYKRLKKDGFV